MKLQVLGVMAMVTITLKNYRCFSDTHPLVVDLEPGLTALVGPNNSGKSSFLKFIFEFQNLWASLLDPGFIVGLATQPQAIRGIGPLRSVLDHNDIACDYTGRPMEIEFAYSAPEAARDPFVQKIRLRANEGNPTAWLGSVTCSPGDCGFAGVTNGRIMNGQGVAVGYEHYRELFSSFHTCMFAPAFRNAINEGATTFYELAVGTALVSLWDQWKAGDSRTAKIAMQQVTKDIQHIFRFKSLEINTAANGKTFDIFVDGHPYRLNDLGAGLSQFIILFANVAIRKPGVLLLDEPELNLHPSLQADFLTSLAAYTSTHSVIFATHSIGLARAMAERVYSFQLTPSGAVVRPFENTPNYAEFVGELNFSSVRELGFQTLLVVEGPSEIKAVQQFLRALGKDHDVVALHLGGAAMICAGRSHELAELKRLTPDVAVLIDSERGHAGQPMAPPRETFLSDCAALGFRAMATERRAFENYLTERAIRNVKGTAYRALLPYEKRETIQPCWGKRENWRIARAMTKEEILATDVGQFLAAL